MEKVSPGEAFRVSAETWNGMIDAASDFKRRRNSGTGQRLDAEPPGIVLALNDTGIPLEQYSTVILMAYGKTPPEVVLSSYKSGRAVLSARLYQPTYGITSTLAILQQPLAPGAIGKAVIYGVTPALITRENLYSGNHYLEPQPMSAYLQSTDAGPIKVIAKPEVLNPVKNYALVYIGYGVELYSGQFKVTNASSVDDLGIVNFKIRVVDGYTVTPEADHAAGRVQAVISSPVAAQTLDVTAASSQNVYLVTTFTGSNYQSVFEVTSSYKSSTDQIDYLLLARLTFTNGVMAIRQNYKNSQPYNLGATRWV